MKNKQFYFILTNQLKYQSFATKNWLIFSTIDIIADQDQGKSLNAKWVLTILQEKDIPIASPKNDTFEQMHHKFFIFKKNLFDKPLLVIGSYNPTDHSTTHSWDDILITDDSNIIEQYQNRFEEVKKRSTP